MWTRDEGVGYKRMYRVKGIGQIVDKGFTKVGGNGGRAELRQLIEGGVRVVGVRAVVRGVVGSQGRGVGEQKICEAMDGRLQGGEVRGGVGSIGQDDEGVEGREGPAKGVLAGTVSSGDSKGVGADGHDEWDEGSQVGGGVVGGRGVKIEVGNVGELVGRKGRDSGRAGAGWRG